MKKVINWYLCSYTNAKDTVLVNDSGNEITDDEQDFGKVAASEALDNLDAVRCLDESRGDKPMKLILKELIRKKETLKLQNVTQSTIHMIFKK